MEKLTDVLISCGAIACEHLAALTHLDDVKIAAVCNLSAARVETTAERFDVAKWYTNDKQEDTRPDVVHVATPPSAHFSPTAGEA